MFDLPPPTPIVEVVVASEGISDGVRETDGIQTKVEARLESGPLFGGVSYRNTEHLSDNPDVGEANAFVGAHGTVAGFGIEGRMTYKHRTADRVVGDRDTVEFEGRVNRQVGPFNATAGLEYNPDDLGLAGETFYAKGGVETTVTEGTSLSAGIGRGWGDNYPTYTSYNAGVTQSLGDAVAFDVRYYGTSDVKHVAASDFRNYGDRVVASLKFKF
jgi:uncharacterized protein (TIGR02001 family)